MDRTDLHEYQNYCVEFLESHPEAMLILQMGLGKTAISLTAILDLMFDSFDVGKALVIGPLRVVKTVWPEECESWEHASFLQMSVVVGSVKQREAALQTPADIYIINRENVKWLVDYLEKRHISWPFDMVVIDELSSFKNHQSQRFKALRKVRPFIKRMVGLTGTPASNGLMDLWAETFLIDKGKRLGRFIGRYREAYFRPAGMNPYTGVVFDYELLPGAEEAIYSRISDITVSMKALDYLDMPDQVMVNHYVDMSSGEREVYDRMQKELLVELGDDIIDAADIGFKLSQRILQYLFGDLSQIAPADHIVPLGDFHSFIVAVATVFGCCEGEGCFLHGSGPLGGESNYIRVLSYIPNQDYFIDSNHTLFIAFLVNLRLRNYDFFLNIQNKDFHKVCKYLSINLDTGIFFIIFTSSTRHLCGITGGSSPSSARRNRAWIVRCVS